MQRCSAWKLLWGLNIVYKVNQISRGDKLRAAPILPAKFLENRKLKARSKILEKKLNFEKISEILEKKLSKNCNLAYLDGETLTE